MQQSFQDYNFSGNLNRTFRSLRDKDLASSRRSCPGHTRCSSITGATSTSPPARAQPQHVPLPRRVLARRRRWLLLSPSKRTLTTSMTNTTATSRSIQWSSRSRLPSASVRTAVSVRYRTVLCCVSPCFLSDCDSN